ncbi:MAG: sigma-70 family RNA polymerase sigma factor [Synergistales bacterium]
MSGTRQDADCRLPVGDGDAGLKEEGSGIGIELLEDDSDEDEILSLSDEPVEPALDYEDFFRDFLGRTSLLSAEEEKQLSRRILEHHDKEAFDRFVTANLRLVVACARKLRARYGCRSFLTFMDLVQEGILGLMTAVARFDYRRNTRFSTYGIPWIYQRMRVAYLQHRWGFSVPGYAGISAQVHSDEIRAFRDGKAEPAEDPVRRERIRDLARISQNLIPIDSWPDAEAGSAFRVDPEKHPLGDSARSSPQDPSQDETAGTIEKRILRESVLETLREGLSQTEYDILARRFGIGECASPHTLADIGAEYGKSSEYARSVLNRVMGKLRHNRKLEALGEAWEVLYPGEGREAVCSAGGVLEG